MSLPSQAPEHPEGKDHDGSFSSIAGPSLPHPLPAVVAGHYQALFTAVREGNGPRLAELDRGTGTDEGTALLLPDYLAERYLSTAFHPSEGELADWLRRYPHLPDAAPLRQKLEELRKGAGQGGVVTINGYENVADLHKVERSVPFSQTLARNTRLERALMDRASHGPDGVQKAIAQLRVTPGMTPVYAAQLHGEIAMQALSQGDTRNALRIGVSGLEKGQHKVGLPGFVAGLAAWREGQLDAAYTLFEAAANAGQTDGSV